MFEGSGSRFVDTGDASIFTRHGGDGHLSRITTDFATHYWHWFFYAQPEIPERVINADPDAWYHANPATMGQENYDQWRDAIRKPEVVRAMLEDYRAGLTIDRRHEEADRAAGTKLQCPTLVLWSEHDDLEATFLTASDSR